LTSQSETLSLLRDTLSEARASVRAYDTKAQIVSVGYIFTLGVLSQVGSTIGQPPQVDLKLLITFWAIVIVPILLFGFVLYPSRKTAPHLDTDDTMDIKKLLYVDAGQQLSVQVFRAALDEANPIEELLYEILKVSGLRELKRKRFVRALVAAGLCFAVVFSFQLLRTVT
jgi:hypothetical protein